jgi:hypothetical protein
MNTLSTYFLGRSARDGGSVESVGAADSWGDAERGAAPAEGRGVSHRSARESIKPCGTLRWWRGHDLSLDSPVSRAGTNPARTLRWWTRHDLSVHTASGESDEPTRTVRPAESHASSTRDAWSWEHGADADDPSWWSPGWDTTSDTTPVLRSGSDLDDASSGPQSPVLIRFFRSFQDNDGIIKFAP